MTEVFEMLSDFHVEWTWRATLWMGFWILGLRLLRPPLGAIQHAIWALILGAMLTLPFVRWSHPQVVATDHAWHAVETAYIALDNPSAKPIETPIAISPAKPGQWQSLSKKISLSTILGMVYVLCVGWMSLKLCLGYIDLKRLIYKAQDTDDEHYQNLLNRLTQDLNIHRPVVLKISPEVDGPITTGWRKPIVVLPRDLFETPPTEEIECILIHELAHIRRHDFVVTCLQRLCEAVFFYHPLVWYVSHHVTLHRELACDDWVLTQNPNRRVYAMSLIDHVAGPGQTPRLASTFFGAPSRLTVRIQQIMNAHRSIVPTISRKILGMALTLTLMGLTIIGCFALVRTGRVDPGVQTLLIQASTAAQTQDIATADYYANAAAGKALEQPASADRKRNLLHVLQMRASWTMDFAKRRTYYKSALNLAHDLNDLRAQAQLHTQLGLNAPDSIKRPHLKAAKQLYATLGDHKGEGRVLFWQACNRLSDGDLDRAQAEFNRVESLLNKSVPSLAISAVAAHALLARDDRDHLAKRTTAYGLGCTMLRIEDGAYTFLTESGNSRSFRRTHIPPVFNRSPFHEAGLLKKMLDPALPVGSRWGGNVRSFGTMPLEGFAILLDDNATVTTPAGTFTQCRQIRIQVTQKVEPENKRIDDLNKWVRGTRDIYYAPGVGIVKMYLETKSRNLAYLLLTQYHVTKETDALLPLDVGNRWTYTWQNRANDTFNEQVFQVREKRDDTVLLSRYHLAYQKEDAP